MGWDVFIKYNENLIFGNEKLLNKIQKKYPDFDFNKKDKSIWALYFKNDIYELPTEKEILIAIKKLDKIQKTSLKGKK